MPFFSSGTQPFREKNKPSIPCLIVHSMLRCLIGRRRPGRFQRNTLDDIFRKEGQDSVEVMPAMNRWMENPLKSGQPEPDEEGMREISTAP